MKCWECKQSRTIPGDCHASCAHPKSGFEGGDPLAAIIAMLASARKLPVAAPSADLGITLNEHGVRHGWAFWPVNFDPIWVDTCNGFEEKDT